jgi:hypothetical protein
MSSLEANMNKTLITCMLASSLIVLPLSASEGNESTPGKGSRDMGWTTLPLPPVPHLDTIDWLNSPSDVRRRPNFLGPQLDNLAPFLLDAKTPPRQFSSSGRGASDSWLE